MANPKHLELARQGRDAWNKWRRENPDEPADFCGVDFTAPENQSICFAKFEFGYGADFSHAQFGDLAENFCYKSAKEILKVLQQDMAPGGGGIFTGATFGDIPSFEGATFGSFARFDGAIFGIEACFKGATFGSFANFIGAKFESIPSFEGATFGFDVNFIGATFGDDVNFIGATFGSSASFDGAIFGCETYFNDATFGSFARFDGVTFVDWTDFKYATFGDRASFEAQSKEEVKQKLDDLLWRKVADESIVKRFETAWQEAEPNPLGFGHISFHGTRFLGGVSFANRNFGSEADFAHARFDQPPDFRGTEGHDNLNWASVRFGFGGTVRNIPTPGWTTNTEIGVRLRRLRKIATAILALDAERNLLILQRMAERGVLWKNDWRRPWRPLVPTVLMLLYRLLSNCGRSMLLPFFWMFVSSAGFFSLYKSQIAPGPQPGDVTDALWTFTHANAVPFGGASQQSLQQAIKVLFGDGVVIPPWVQIVSTLQGTVSALLIFLLLLAMRNYFRFK